jgi:hypothetical protein
VEVKIEEATFEFKEDKRLREIQEELNREFDLSIQSPKKEPKPPVELTPKQKVEVSAN